MMRKYQKEKYQINLVSVFAVDLPYATVIPPVTFLGLTLDTPERPKTPNPTPLNMFPGQIQILYCHARQCAENFFLYGFYSKENLLWTNFENLFRIDQIFPPSTPFSFLFVIFQPLWTICTRFPSYDWKWCFHPHFEEERPFLGSKGKSTS